MDGSLNDAFCMTALVLKRVACYAYTHQLLELARSTSLDFNVEEEQVVYSDERVHQLGT